MTTDIDKGTTTLNFLTQEISPNRNIPPTDASCFGSINLKNGNFISSFHDKGNAEATIEHFTKVRNNYNENIQLAFLIDNASWHKTLTVTEYCEKNNITLLFLPPYSPEYNPIERVWSFIKSKIKQKFFLTAKKFKSFVLNFFENINTTNSEELSSQCCSLI